MEIALSVNGRGVVRDVAPQELLLDFLRDSLGLTGAKRSCDVQVCGACTVLVDGRPVSSCCFLAADADGARGDDDRRARRAAGVRAARGGLHAARGAAVRLLHAGDAAHGQRAPATAASWTARRRSSGASPATFAAAPATAGSSRPSRSWPGSNDGAGRDRHPDADRPLRTRAATRARSCAARPSSSATCSSRGCCTGRSCAARSPTAASSRSTPPRPRRFPASSAS